MGRKLGLEKVLDCFSLSYLCTNACVCVHSAAEEDEDEESERRALVSRQLQELVKLKDFVDGVAKTLAFHLEPKTVELKVSMHCYGCAKKVQKHIAKMDGNYIRLWSRVVTRSEKMAHICRIDEFFKHLTWAPRDASSVREFAELRSVRSRSTAPLRARQDPGLVKIVRGIKEKRAVAVDLCAAPNHSSSRFQFTGCLLVCG